MTTTIKTKEHGTLVFWAPEGAMGYIYLDGKQICDGGNFTGYCVTCTGTQSNLDKQARKWWAARLRNLKAEE